MENKLKKNLKFYSIATAIALAFAIGLFCLFFFVRGKTHGYGLINWQDSLMLTGVVVACFGGLMFVANEGFFDFAAYGFKQLGGAMFGRKPHEYHDYPGYAQEKKAKRKSSPKAYIPVLLLGVAILVAALIVYFAYLSASK